LRWIVAMGIIYLAKIFNYPDITFRNSIAYFLSLFIKKSIQ